MVIRQGIKAEIEELKRQKASLLSAVASIEKAIQALEGNPDRPMDWKNSAWRCLKLHQFPMRTVDILNCLFVNNPEKLKDPVKRRYCVNALSIALNNLCDYRFLDRVAVPGYKGYFYGIASIFAGLEAMQKFVKEARMHELLYNPDSEYYLGDKLAGSAEEVDHQG